jgi:class 3 adenylate cyclase
VSARRVLDRRRAAVLFADIVGFTPLCERAGVEHAYAIVTGCLKLLDGVARRHGGVVDKYLGDALMAVFGIPAPLENPSAAAIAAALEMQRTVEAYNRQVQTPVPLALKAGVNTGMMTAGDLRSDVVREFHVMGDAVNVAARLKERSSPGTVYVGGDAADDTRGQFAFEPLAPLALKGKSVTVAAYAARAAAEDARTAWPQAMVFTPLVGRGHELGELRAAVRALARSPGAVVTLVGEAGIGKTRLLHELAQDLASEPGRTWLATRTVAAAVAALEDASGPVVLAFDDAHDALRDDAPSVLAAAVAARPALVLAAVREDAAASRLQRAAASHGVPHRELRLDPLSAAESEALLAHVDAGSSLDPGARRLVLERARGNPFRLIFGALLAPALESERGHAEGAVERSSEAERRRATVMFADISGFTALSERLDPAEAYDAVTGCLRLLHATAEKWGGTVDKYLGDAVMAVFGVPIAIEDAPCAAVNAAIEMRRLVRAYNEKRALTTPLDVHIGIDTGLGIAGDVSGPLLREFALMGESVGRASRLTSLAPNGRIFLGHETVLATRERFEVRRVESSEAKPGVPDDEAYELVSEREQVHRPRVGRGATLFAELVGRERELAVLHAAVDDVAAGRGGVAAVFGEPGIGKSRLLDELRVQAAARDVRCLEARSLAIGAPLRFHPFVDLLHAFAGIDRDDDEAALAKLRQASRAVLGDDADELVPFLAVVLALKLPPELEARVDAVKGDALDRLVVRAMRDLLEGLAAAAPVAVVFEDVHWADRSSVEMLMSLVRASLTAPILLVLAARPGFADTADAVAAAAQAVAGARYRRLDLKPLDRSGVRRLLAGLFAHGELPRALRERLETNTAGSPLFLEEVVRTLVEQGVLEAAGDKLQATAALDTVTVPGTVQEVILSRVDRLDPVAKQVLQLAAVIGRGFSEALLARLAPEPARVPDALLRLLDAQLLVERTREGRPELAVKHPMIQEVSYDAILESRREELHRAVAAALEAEGDASDPARHGLLAYHYGRGRDAERAEEHLLLAGDDAARAAASAEAVYFFEEASRLYLARHGDGGDPAKRIALEKKLATAYFYRGRLVEAGEQFNRALGRLGIHIPRGRGDLNLSLVRSLVASLPPLYLPMGRRRPPASAHDLEVLELMLDRARAQTTGDPTRFVVDTLEALRRLSRLDPATVPGACTLFASTAGLFAYSGLSFDVSERFLRLAERYLDRDDPTEVLVFQMMRFTHAFLAGDWSRELEIDPALLDGGVARGQLWDVATHLGLEGTKLVVQGRFAEAEERVARIATIEQRYDYDLASSNRHSVCASLLLEQRRLLDALQAADTYVVEHDEPLLNVIALGLKAKVEVLLDDLAAAEDTLAAADALVARLGRIPPLHRAHCARSRLLLELARAEAVPAAKRARLLASARRTARRAVRLALRVAWLQPEVLRAAGTCCWLADQQRHALRLWQRSLEAARRLEAGAEHARTQVEIAQRLIAAGRGGETVVGRSARQHLLDARRHFESLGLEQELATVGSAA